MDVTDQYGRLHGSPLYCGGQEAAHLSGSGKNLAAFVEDFAFSAGMSFYVHAAVKRR